MDLLDQLLADASARRSLPAPAVARAVRQHAGLTQQDVADVLGVTRVTVTRWESGTRAPWRTNAPRYAALLERLAKDLSTKNTPLGPEEEVNSGPDGTPVPPRDGIPH